MRVPPPARPRLFGPPTRPQEPYGYSGSAAQPPTAVQHILLTTPTQDSIVLP